MESAEQVPTDDERSSRGMPGADSEVLPPYRQRPILFFLTLLVSWAATVAIFFVVLYADSLNGWVERIFGVLALHPWIGWFCASTPLIMTIVISAHYARKGMQRRGAAEKLP